jgi:hypothetical protein
MYARCLTLLFFVGTLAGVTRAIAAEEPPPPSASSDVLSVVRQVAAALAAGTDAIEDLRGPPIENSNLDRLKLPTPGMDCGIARSVVHVACRSAALGKQEAEAMFARIMNDLQTALAADNWIPFDATPRADFIRVRSYFHAKSNAQIDIGLVAYPGLAAQPLYALRVYGWKRF